MFESFQEWVKNYRLDEGLTQEDLAKKWGFSSETISAWERGIRKPRGQQIPHLASCLETTPEALRRSLENNHVKIGDHKEHNEVDESDEKKASPDTFDTKNEIRHIYRNRTDFSGDHSYASIFAEAHTILAIGISLNPIAMNYSREKLIELVVEKNCSIALCFLDPKSFHCKEREQEESLSEETLASLININVKNMEVIHQRIGRINMEAAKRLQVMHYAMPPKFNIYLIDETFMTIQFYAHNRGEDTPIFVLERKSRNGLFEFYASAAKYILEHATPVEAGKSTEGL